jgi:Xaa-Pro dipeptidase
MRRARRDSELPFPAAVLTARIRRVQARLRADGLAGALLFDPENIYYLTGFQSIGYFTYQTLLLPSAGCPTLISRKVNQYLARATPSLGTFVPIADTADPVAVTLEALKRTRGRLGLETSAWYLTADTYERLRAEGGRDWVPWSGVVERERIVKTPAELTRIRDAARAAEAGLRAAIEALGVGVSDNDVAAAMHRASIAAGSEYLGHPPLVAAGERSGLCFATWRRRVLRHGDVVFLEAAGCVDRYHAILARTAVLGRASRAVRHVADALRRALDAAIATMRPGVASGAVDRACRAVLERAGLGRRFAHRTGYAVGIGFPPNWSEGRTLALRPGDPTLLQPGMTFHVVPTVFGDGIGMCLSETVAVTARGVDVVTRFPRELITV